MRLPFDPADDAWWSGQSDVDWVRGQYVAGLSHPGRVAKLHPWLVTNRLFAESMVKMNKRLVLDLFDALISWQICTVSQLDAGLCASTPPKFDRGEPNLYGALTRLGAINMGFDAREKLDGVAREQTWVSMSNDSKLVKRVLKLLAADEWQYRTYSQNRLTIGRPHARHNTLAAHTGLALSMDDRVRFTTGDGWGGFRFIDKRALDESGMERMSTADVVCMGRNNVLAGLEVQAGMIGLETKLRHWAQFLAYSPMRRRGVTCVFLYIKRPNVASYPPFRGVTDRVANMPEMMVGEPTVASRMGWAVWDDWFDHGQPTERLGCYTDMMGRTRSILDPAWREHTPEVRDPKVIEDWGWVSVADQLREQWGVDVSGWRLPEQWRGGFHGFTVNNDGGER